MTALLAELRARGTADKRASPAAGQAGIFLRSTAVRMEQ